MKRSVAAGLAGSFLLAEPFGATDVAASPYGGAPYTTRLAQAAPTPDANGLPPAAPPLGGAPGVPQAAPVPPTPIPQPAAPAGTQATLPTPSPQAATPTTPPPAGASPGGAPPPLGTVRNNPGSALPGTAGVDPQYYGGTLSSPGRPQGGLVPTYGGTQRNNSLSDADNAHPIAGASPYGGTQSTIGTPQFGTTSPYGRPSGVGVNASTQTQSLTGTTLPGNAGNYGQAPLGSSPVTRDQIGSFGGTAGYTAQGIYTGVAGQAIGYGQPYASSGRPVGGVSSYGPDATTPLRPYVPLNTGRSGGPTNSGYGIPNGSRATTMDARGIQRTN